jgi:hypothetical protein
MRGPAAVASLLLVAAVTLAQEPVSHGIDRFGGSPRARETLLRRGFVVTDETCRQIFSFYIGQDRVFVTTDSLLHAYFVNVEESFKALEMLQSQRLYKLVPPLRERLAKLRTEGEESIDKLLEEKKLDPAWREAADAVDAYLHVAQILLVGSPPADGPVAEEIALILAARGDGTSPLRGIPLDYARFDPSAAPLPNYHRAITWLYDVPFRIADEQETRQAMLLAAISDVEDDPSAESIAGPYREFLGRGDDLDIGAYTDVFHRHIRSFAELATDPERWRRCRAELARLPDPRHPTSPTPEAVIDPALFKGLRFLARPLLIDHDVFKALTPFGVERAPPSGEEFMAALGSAAAEVVTRGSTIQGYDDLRAQARAAVAAADAQPSTVLCQAQRAVVRSLLEPPARADLPAYYVHPDWRFKDLNTCLAGWAHHRYIWSTHAKVNIYYAGAVDGHRGLVEPNEAFFGALLDLTMATGAFFTRHGVAKHRFGDLADLLVELRVALRAQLEGRPPGPEQEVFNEFGPNLAGICGFRGNSWLVDANLPDHTFAVPVARDLATGAERWVGQARPRALYVVAEQGGHRFVFVGGVLSYRDHVAPAAGEGRMTLELWKERAASGMLPAPDWHARFGVTFTDEELLAEVRAGRIGPQVLVRPPVGIGELLAEKLQRGDKFTLEGALPTSGIDPRRVAIDLFAKSGHPRVVEVLFPMLERPTTDSTYLEGWPEAAALAGRLGEDRIPTLLRWADGASRTELFVALIATIPGEKAQEVVLGYLDRTAAEVRMVDSCPFAAVARAFVRHGGLPAARLLLDRCDRYGEHARAIVLDQLKRKWREPAKPNVHSSTPPPAYTDEEREFARALYEKLGEKGK